MPNIASLSAFRDASILAANDITESVCALCRSSARPHIKSRQRPLSLLILSQQLKPLVGAQPNSLSDVSLKVLRCVCSQVSAFIYVYTQTRSIRFRIRSIFDAGTDVMAFEKFHFSRLLQWCVV